MCKFNIKMTSWLKQIVILDNKWWFKCWKRKILWSRNYFFQSATLSSCKDTLMSSSKTWILISQWVLVKGMPKKVWINISGCLTLTTWQPSSKIKFLGIFSPNLKKVNSKISFFQSYPIWFRHLPPQLTSTTIFTKIKPSWKIPKTS